MTGTPRPPQPTTNTAARRSFCLAGRADFLQRRLARVVGCDSRPYARARAVGVRVLCGMLRAALAVHPAGIAVLVVLLLPDGHPMLDLVDDVAAGAECLVAMARRDTDPHRLLADLERTDPVHADGVLDAEPRDRLGDDPLAFLDRERLEGFVLQPAHAPAFVVIANPTLERGIAAAGGIAELGPQSGLVEGVEEKRKVMRSPARHRRNEHDRIARRRSRCSQSPNSELTATRSISGASENG